MNRLILLLLVLVSAVPLLPRAAPPPAADLASLAWLAGEWRGRVGEAEVVSWHSDPSGGAIVMASKEIEGGHLTLFDFGLVREGDGQVAYQPFPFGKPGPAFLLEAPQAGVQRAVFANAAHDFPQRFTFERKGDTLAIVLEGDQGEGPMSVAYELKLAGAASAVPAGAPAR
jgi:hypothetical protein